MEWRARGSILAGERLPTRCWVGLALLLVGCGEGLYTAPPSAAESFVPGAVGTVDLQAARFVVRSGTFDQTVTVALRLSRPPRSGSEGNVYAVELRPAGVLPKTPARFELRLTDDQDREAAGLQLAFFQANTRPEDGVGYWIGLPNQEHRAAERTLSADTNGFDADSAVAFALVRKCPATAQGCGPLLACLAGYCQ
jgi:hypothetical protein